MNFFMKLVIVFLVIRYGLLGWLFPAISQWATGAPDSLPAPAAALSMYTVLILIALGVYVLSSRERVKAFMDPVHDFLKPREGGKKILQMAALAAIPVFGGWQYFDANAPKMVSPTAVRIQHPTMPGAYEKLENDLRTPTEAQIQAFRAEQATLAEDDENAGMHVPENREAGRKELLKKWTEEGALLYAINCRPCHGMQANGLGPMAVGWRLKPANFRDPGTLSTIVESYAYWRVSKGGPGLPSASTPWDSAMPIWDLDLSEHERWKVLLGEYFLAGVGPRQPEKREP